MVFRVGFVGGRDSVIENDNSAFRVLHLFSTDLLEGSVDWPGVVVTHDEIGFDNKDLPRAGFVDARMCSQNLFAYGHAHGKYLVSISSVRGGRRKAP